MCSQYSMGPTIRNVHYKKWDLEPYLARNMSSTVSWFNTSGQNLDPVFCMAGFLMSWQKVNLNFVSHDHSSAGLYCISLCCFHYPRFPPLFVSLDRRYHCSCTMRLILKRWEKEGNSHLRPKLLFVSPHRSRSQSVYSILAANYQHTGVRHVLSSVKHCRSAMVRDIVFSLRSRRIIRPFFHITT